MKGRYVAPESIPLPPEEYMDLVCGAHADVKSTFINVGQRMREDLDAYGLVFEGCRLLDVGCGCGRLARNLINDSLKSYTGFDRHRGMIDWCRSHIAPRAPHFSFRYFDLRSIYQSVDSQSGSIAAQSFQFPFDDNSFDVAILMSVFTHMPLQEIHHYLKELYRVLDKEGKVLLTVFLTERPPYVDTINYFYNPEQFRDAVVSSGLQFDPYDSKRLLTGDNLKFDRFQHNGFLLWKG